jgi:hypothetical protein
VLVVHEGLVLSIFCMYNDSVRLIEMMCECACATVSERFTVADHFFSLGEDD